MCGIYRDLWSWLSSVVAAQVVLSAVQSCVSNLIFLNCLLDFVYSFFSLSLQRLKVKTSQLVAPFSVFRCLSLFKLLLKGRFDFFVECVSGPLF